jgi:hypothetical protein
MKVGMYSLASLLAAEGALGLRGCAPAGGILEGAGEVRVGVEGQVEGSGK